MVRDSPNKLFSRGSQRCTPVIGRWSVATSGVAAVFGVLFGGSVVIADGDDTARSPRFPLTDYGTNLTNKHQIVGGDDFTAAGVGYVINFLGPPRKDSVELTQNF